MLSPQPKQRALERLHLLNQQALARLSALNREAMPRDAVAKALPPEVAPPVVVASEGESAPTVDNSPDAAPLLLRSAPRGATELELLAPGEVVENAAGKHYRIRTPLARLWPRSEELIDRWIRQANDVREHLQQGGAPGDLLALADALLEGAVYLDLETCGFAGSMVFLVGLLHRSDDGLVLDQLLARDYAEEASMLAAIWPIAARNRVLATFNGKSFDWPMVHDRSTVHRLGRPELYPNAKPSDDVGLPGFPLTDSISLGPKDRRPALLHCDLLHHARRLWSRRLPNCKLQTIERHLCRRVRGPDIPGAEIPAAYHHFARTEDARRMSVILNHNALDLATLLEIAYRAVCEAAYLGTRR